MYRKALRFAPIVVVALIGGCGQGTLEPGAGRGYGTEPVSSVTEPAVSLVSCFGSYSDPAGTGDSAARAAMAKAAPDTKGAQDESTWQDAPYWYSLGRWFEEADGKITETRKQESWYGPAESVTVYDGNLAKPLRSEPPAWKLDDFDPKTSAPVPFALPGDPGALETELRRAAGAADALEGDELCTSQVDDRVWVQITDVWPGSPATTAQRLAFLQVATRLSDTVVTTDVTDSEGRTGISITRRVTAGADETITLVVDPADGTVLEQRSSFGGFDWALTYLAMGPTSDLPKV